MLFQAIVFGVGLTAGLAACGASQNVAPFPLRASAAYREPARAGTVLPYVGVYYSVPSQQYSEVQTTVKVSSFPDRYTAYYWPLILKFAHGPGFWLRLNTAVEYINGRGAELELFKSGGSGEISCPAKGQGSGIVPACCPSEYYGGSVTCIAGFPWATGRTYKLSVALTSKSGSDEQWTAEAISAGNKTPFLVGTWKVPASWGLLEPSSKAPLAVQVVGPILPTCGEEPYAATTFANPILTITGKHKVTAKIAGTYFGDCKSNAVVKASPGDSQAAIQMGYAWRPGATPSPSPSPPIGTPVFTPLPAPTGSPLHLSDPIKVGALQQVLAGNTYGLVNFPDEQVSTLRFSDGSFRMWVAGGATAYGEDATFLLSFKTLKDLTPVPAAMPYASAVYNTWDPGTGQFDANYSGPGTVTPASNGRDLLMIYHGENHFYDGYDYINGSPGGYFYCAIGLARSSDDGETWSRAGAIITGAFKKPLRPATGGACNPTVVAVGGYLYAAYIEGGPNSGGIALARAPRASDGVAGSWKKYYKGAFSSDALHHGKYTAVVTSVIGEPNITFNTYLNSFVMLIPSQADQRQGTIYWLTSQDLIHWSTPRAVIKISSPACNPANITICYPSLISEGEAASQVTGQTGYIYVTHAVNGTRGMYRYPYTIGKAPP